MLFTFLHMTTIIERGAFCMQPGQVYSQAALDVRWTLSKLASHEHVRLSSKVARGADPFNFLDQL